MTGWGRMNYKNGASYFGQWVNNEYNGLGRLIWSNGDSYIGPFSYGSMHGDGIYKYKDGSE